MQLDDEGYFDRRCPAEECGAAFKVFFEDWKEKVLAIYRDDQTERWCSKVLKEEYDTIAKRLGYAARLQIEWRDGRADDSAYRGPRIDRR